MKQIKCQNCSANIDIDKLNHELYCPYCNTKYSLDDNTNKETSRNIQHVNINQQREPLSTKHALIGILLFFICWPIGVIYLISKYRKKKD